MSDQDEGHIREDMTLEGRLVRILHSHVMKLRGRRFNQ